MEQLDEGKMRDETKLRIFVSIIILNAVTAPVFPFISVWLCALSFIIFVAILTFLRFYEFIYCTYPKWISTEVRNSSAGENDRRIKPWVTWLIVVQAVLFVISLFIIGYHGVSF